MGGEQVEVVGRHRGSHRLVTMVVRAAWLEAPRVKLVYQPAVVARLVAPPGTLGTSAHGDGFVPWDGSPEARARAELAVRAIEAGACLLDVSDVQSAGGDPARVACRPASKTPSG